MLDFGHLKREPRIKTFFFLSLTLLAQAAGAAAPPPASTGTRPLGKTDNAFLGTQTPCQKAHYDLQTAMAQDQRAKDGLAAVKAEKKQVSHAKYRRDLSQAKQALSDSGRAVTHAQQELIANHCS